ncbi:hypothetical protein JTB14_028202 [Gonioctena quinquepunctata]|nr:hypothetical protein JTB14_028202 [Gonioctena quinquepunctata]
MSRSRKSTAAEAKLKKKEYDRKRREKLKNCPETLEKLREKERLKYLKKREKVCNCYEFKRKKAETETMAIKLFKIQGEESKCA